MKKIILIVICIVICYWMIVETKEPFKIFSLASSKDEYICSKKCCAVQWPTSIKIKDDEIANIDIGFNKKYKTSNMYCNDSQKDSGCICAKNII